MGGQDLPDGASPAVGRRRVVAAPTRLVAHGVVAVVTAVPGVVPKEVDVVVAAHVGLVQGRGGLGPAIVAGSGGAAATSAAPAAATSSRRWLLSMGVAPALPRRCPPVPHGWHLVLNGRGGTR